MNNSFLEKLSQKGKEKRREVIYGVYDNKRDSMFTRFNDFLIDHSNVKIKDKSYFFHMLAVMVDAGIPVVAAVRAYAGRTQNERFARILTTIAYNSEHGMKLSDAMSTFSDVFTDVEIGVIKSGEAVGRLGPMLFKLSEQVGRSHDLRMKLWGAAFYPIAVLGTLVIVAVAMLVWVFPTLMSVLTEGGLGVGELPTATKILLFLQTALIDYYWAILAGIALIYGLFKMYVSTSDGALYWDYLKLKMPIVGDLLKRVYVLQFVSLIGVLIEAGLPVIESLEIVGNSLPNKVYRLKMREVIDGVRDGEKISTKLADTPFLFPPEVVEMLRVGEASAALGEVSTKVSGQYQMEIDHSLKKLTAVFEPFMILIVGLFVGLLALAVMAPIFNLSASIN